MPQRRTNLRFASRAGLVTFSLLLMITPSGSVAQDRLSDFDSRPATEAVSPLASTSVIAAVLCFTVGFGACLLVVHYLLPSLVHAQCVEIVREYMDHVQRESDIRVVVLDRETHKPLQAPRRASGSVAEPTAESSNDSQPHVRVDPPVSADAPGSMLTQIYEQNLHLRDQLRKQSRSVKR